MRKRAKIENHDFDAQLHSHMCSHFLFQENPSNGLGGVAITKFFFFQMRTSKGRNLTIWGQIKKW